MTQPINSIDSAKLIPPTGPWETKSHASLSVLFNLSQPELEIFLNFSNNEFDQIPINIRGLRTYTVSRLKNKAIGANEWHKVRTEIVQITSGRVRWTVEDVYGNKKAFILSPQTGVLIIPNFILHTYECLEDDSQITITCNTTFDPENVKTFDTFLRQDFPFVS